MYIGKFFLVIFFVQAVGAQAEDPPSQDPCEARAVTYPKGYDVAALRELLDRYPNFQSDSGYYLYGDAFSFPVQGWKFHISFPEEFPMAILQRVIPMFHEKYPNLGFKIPGRDIFDRYTNNKLDRQFGKLITVFPLNSDETKRLLADLKPILLELEKECRSFVTALSDSEIGLGPVGVYGRYGRINTSYVLENSDLIRVDSPGQAIRPDGSLILYEGQPVTLSDLHVHDRNYSRLHEGRRLARLLREQGALLKDDRSKIPEWSLPFLDFER